MIFNLLNFSTHSNNFKVLGFNIAQAGVLASLPYLARLFSGFIFGSIGDALTKNQLMSVTAIRKTFCFFCMWYIFFIVYNEKIYIFQCYFFSSHFTWIVFDWIGICRSSSVLVCSCDHNIAWLQWCFNSYQFTKFSGSCAKLCRNTLRCF